MMTNQLHQHRLLLFCLIITTTICFNTTINAGLIGSYQSYDIVCPQLEISISLSSPVYQHIYPISSESREVAAWRTYNPGSNSSCSSFGGTTCSNDAPGFCQSDTIYQAFDLIGDVKKEYSINVEVFIWNQSYPDGKLFSYTVRNTDTLELLQFRLEIIEPDDLVKFQGSNVLRNKVHPQQVFMAPASPTLNNCTEIKALNAPCGSGCKSDAKLDLQNLKSYLNIDFEKKRLTANVNKNISVLMTLFNATQSTKVYKQSSGVRLSGVQCKNSSTDTTDQNISKINFILDLWSQCNLKTAFHIKISSLNSGGNGSYTSVSSYELAMPFYMMRWQTREFPATSYLFFDGISRYRPPDDPFASSPDSPNGFSTQNPTFDQKECNDGFPRCYWWAWVLMFFLFWLIAALFFKIIFRIYFRVIGYHATADSQTTPQKPCLSTEVLKKEYSNKEQQEREAKDANREWRRELASTGVSQMIP